MVWNCSRLKLFVWLGKEHQTGISAVGWKDCWLKSELNLPRRPSVLSNNSTNRQRDVHWDNSIWRKERKGLYIRLGSPEATVSRADSQPSGGLMTGSNKITASKRSGSEFESMARQAPPYWNSEKRWVSKLQRFQISHTTSFSLLTKGMTDPNKPPTFSTLTFSSSLQSRPRPTLSFTRSPIWSIDPLLDDDLFLLGREWIGCGLSFCDFLFDNFERGFWWHEMI